MNLHRINLALAVALLDFDTQCNPLVKAKIVLRQFQKEIGHFRGLVLSNREQLSPVFDTQQALMNFDHCTIALELVTNLRNQRQYISNVKLRSPLPIQC